MEVLTCFHGKIEFVSNEGFSWIFHHQVRLPEVKVDFQGRSSWRLVQPRLPAGSTRNNGPWALWMALVSSKSTPPYGRHPSVRPGPVCQQIRRISYDWWTVGRGGASLMHSLRGISQSWFLHSASSWQVFSHTHCGSSACCNFVLFFFMALRWINTTTYPTKLSNVE